MPIAHRYIEAIDLIVSVWNGPVTPAEWSDSVAAQIDNQTWVGGTRRLTDARTADTSMISVEAIEGVTETFHESEVQIAGVKLAIIANEGWAVAQQVEVSMRKLGASTVVFNDVHTACAWLGVDPDLVSATLGEIRAELRGHASEQ